MRNLKRALSLALASVMLLGMMVVGTSAKGLEDFSDAAEINNADAVAVTSAIGIFKGYDDGEFKGSNVVTRAEMAVIIAKMLYGADVKVEQFAEIDSFTDVPAWAEGYVNLCASLGIVAGRGNGIFDPNATVTTAEAAMMLTKALGYFQSARDFGDDWILAATAKATELGLYGDLKLSAKAPLNRENVAVMVFNALTKAVPVQYNELLGVYYNQNQGIIYSLEFNYLQTLGYKNFDLVYKSDAETIYGRPATTWGFGSYTAASTTTASGNKDGKLTDNGGLIASLVRMLSTDEIVTVANTPDYVYTANTKEKDVYADLGKNVAGADTDYDWTWFVNGEEVDGDLPSKTGTGRYEFTNKGAVTEIYIDDADLNVTVVMINYYLGEVSKVKNDYVVVKELSDIALDDNTFATKAFEEDELVVFTVDMNEDEEFYICEMAAPSVTTGDVVRVENDDKSIEGKDSYIKLDDGSKHSYSAYNVYDLDDTTAKVHPTLNTEYNLYLDPNGYVLGFEEAEETVAQYLYVKDTDEEMNDWRAKVLLADGTTKTVDVKTEVKSMDKEGNYVATKGAKADINWDANYDKRTQSNIDGKVFSYTVNSNGVYTLTRVDFVKAYTDKNQEVEVHNGKAYFSVGKDDVIVDKKTVFVDDMNDTAYTGYDEVPNVENADMVYVKDGRVVEIAFVLNGDIYDADATYFVLTGTTRESLKYDDELYWAYSKAYVNGEKTTLNIAYDNEKLTTGILYKAVKTIDEDYITEVVEVAELHADGTITAPVDNDIAGEIYALGDDAFWVTNEADKTYKFDADKETEYVLVEKKVEADGDVTWTVSEGNINDLEKPEDDSKYTYTLSVDVVEKDDEYADVVYIYVTETEKGAKAPAVNADGSVTVDVQKGQNDGDKLSIALSAPEVDGKDIASWEGKDAVITIEVVVDGDVYTKVTKVAGTNDVTDILAAAVTPAVAVAPTGTHKVVVSATVAFDGMNNDSYVLSGTSNVLYW